MANHTFCATKKKKKKIGECERAVVSVAAADMTHMAAARHARSVPPPTAPAATPNCAHNRILLLCPPPNLDGAEGRRGSSSVSAASMLRLTHGVVRRRSSIRLACECSDDPPGERTRRDPCSSAAAAMAPLAAAEVTQQ
mgnify:CR=1 FL=1